MLNGCVTAKSSPQSSSSPTSMVSPSSLHSSPQASSTSFGHDRSPVSSPSRNNFPSVPLIKPSAIKDPSLSVHFPPVSTMPSMCFPLHAIYAGQNPYTSMVNNNFSSLFSPHAIARQMSFLGNSFSQSIAGKRIPGEEFSRFPPVFASLSSSHRSPSVASGYHSAAKQSCIFPFASSHGSSASHLSHGQPNIFNSLPSECPSSPPPFKRRMLNIPTESAVDYSAPSDATGGGTSLSNNWCRRSPSQPLACPLCSVSLEGIDINSHFYEEVHKVETLRKLNDWAFNSKECTAESDEHIFESSRSSFEKKLPYSRWETFQRVKQNRHSRLTALVRQTKRKFEAEEFRSGSLLRHDERIWNMASNLNKAVSQKHEDDDDDDDSSSEKNVDVVSDLTHNNSDDKELECEDRNEEDYAHRHLRNANSTNEENRSDGENGTATDGKEIKTLENGLASESEINVNSENSENVRETIDTLRKRIQELENKENDSNNHEPTCFICSNSFTKPVVSLSCFHMHCEQCWVQIVESKRLCPQCDSIVTSRDLRRVYM